MTPEQRAELIRLHEAIEVATTAYNDYAESIDAPEMVTNYQDVAVRCAKSGAYIFDGDEYVRDQDTDEYFLRSAIGLEPRPMVSDNGDEDDIGEAA